MQSCLFLQLYEQELPNEAVSASYASSALSSPPDPPAWGLCKEADRQGRQHRRAARHSPQPRQLDSPPSLPCSSPTSLQTQERKAGSTAPPLSQPEKFQLLSDIYISTSLSEELSPLFPAYVADDHCGGRHQENWSEPGALPELTWSPPAPCNIQHCTLQCVSHSFLSIPMVVSIGERMWI